MELEIVTDEQRIRPEGSEVNRLFGDNTRRQLSGWQPALEGLRASVADWFKLWTGLVTQSTWRVIAPVLMPSEI